MQNTVSNQDKTRVVRNLPPLVEIEGDRVCTFDSSEARRNSRCEHRESAISAVHMKPKPLSLRNIGNIGKIIDGAGIHRTRRPGDKEWRKSETLIDCNCLFERVGIDSALIVHR